MGPAKNFFLQAPDPERLLTERDIQGLIRCLGNRNPGLQWRAADALGRFGSAAIPELLTTLADRRPHVRLGVIEALAAIRDPSVLPQLITLLRSDEPVEIRWACALALGAIGDPRATATLAESLRSPDKYVRYGAAVALRQLGWEPADPVQQAYLATGLQDWDTLDTMRDAAVQPLTDLLRDPDPEMRLRSIELLGKAGGESAHPACTAALRDTDGDVRWAAVLASRRCRIPAEKLPWTISRRHRITPDPLGAALLNFLFLGLGYNYMGLWWGFLVFMSYSTIIVLAQLQLGPFLPYLIAYPVTALFATQTYFMAKKISDL